MIDSVYEIPDGSEKLGSTNAVLEYSAEVTVVNGTSEDSTEVRIGSDTVGFSETVGAVR